jgi:hypothetical protein
MTGGRLVVDLIMVHLMRSTMIDHAPRKEMIRNPGGTGCVAPLRDA